MDDPDCDSTWEDGEDGEEAGAGDADADEEDAEAPRAVRPGSLQVRRGAASRPGRWTQARGHRASLPAGAEVPRG